MLSKATLIKIAKVLKWTKIAAKLAALGTTLVGAVTTLTSSSTAAGVALTATGATTYVAAKSIPTDGYERTTHVPPVPASGRVTKEMLQDAKPFKSAHNNRGAVSVTKSGSIKQPQYVTRKPVLITDDEEAVG